VRASGFRAHGHDADPNYDGVALHVVFRADDGAYTRLASGGDAPVAAFAPWFDSRRDELQHWLGAEALWREPCCDAAGRLGEDGVRLALREAGLRRFETKSAALNALCAKVGEAEALWRTLFDVMGVGGDRDGFRRLAVIFPEPLANAVLASHGTGGLAAALTYVAGEGLAAALDVEGLPLPLRPSLAAGGRPANRPQRRLAGIAALYARAGGNLPAFARAGVESSEAGKAVVAAWQVAGRETALLGSEQARELTLNLALPFAWNDPALRPRAEALLTALGAAAAYGKTAFLERTLRADAGRRPVRSALEQQGLLAYLGEWCSQGGCGRCPLS
jgi:hypothetical protein